MHNLGQSSLESSISSTASLSVAGKASLRLEVSVLWGFAGKLAATHSITWATIWEINGCVEPIEIQNPDRLNTVPSAPFHLSTCKQFTWRSGVKKQTRYSSRFHSSISMSLAFITPSQPGAIPNCVKTHSSPDNSILKPIRVMGSSNLQLRLYQATNLDLKTIFAWLFHVLRWVSGVRMKPQI